MKLVFVLLAALSAAAFGQMRTRITGGGGASSADGSNWSYTARIGPAPAMLPAVTGAPYSGDEVRETVRTMADGSRVTSKTAEQRVYRDSQGRTRVERPISVVRPAAGTKPLATIVEIADPEAGRVCDLDTQNRVAHCSEARPAPPRPPQSGGAVILEAARAKGQTIQTVDGVETIVTTISQRSGLAQGYDRDFTVVRQTWFSPELGIVMMEKNTDPRSGESAFRIENFSRVEPSFDLFQLPSDYELRIETAPFTISYSSR